MAIYDIIPNEVELDDVRDTLNYNGGVAGNTLESLITEAANIDVWSKKKPVIILNTPFPDYSGEWWKANDGNCGLNPLRILNYRNLPDYYENDWANDDMNGWVYNIPQGGSTQPLRLADFRGYNAKAFAPYRGLAVPSRVSKTQTEFQVSCMWFPSSETQIRFTDLRTTKDCYFGVYIAKDGSTLGQRATSSGVEDTTITFKTNGFTTGKYTAYPFFSTAQIGQSDGERVADYYSIPMLEPVEFEIIESFIYLSVAGEAESSIRNRVTYEVYVNNSSSGTVRLTNNYITLRYYDKDFLDPLVVGEQRIKLDDVSVPDGRMLVAEGAFENVNDEVFKNCRIWASFNSAQYLQGVVPLRPMPIP